jgi:hypothetical protein
MATKAATEFKKLRAADLAKWKLTFWIVKQHRTNRVASYSVMRVEIDKKLATRLRGYVRAQVQDRDFQLTEYAFSNSDTDGVLLTLDASETETDFTDVESAIAKVQAATGAGFANARVTSREQLLNSWAYVLEFELGKERLYAWRKINTIEQPKASKSTKALIFRDQKLTDIDDDEVFLIDPNFDFFVFGGITFIASKRQFEVAMNFREGMKAHRDQALADFETLGILKNVDVLRTYIGDNLNHLRKLASIRKAGYYKQPSYLSKLMQINAEKEWGLKVDNGILVAEEATVALLLILLNNDRLQSPINDEVFDSAAKTKVGG